MVENIKNKSDIVSKYEDKIGSDKFINKLINSAI